MPLIGVRTSIVLSEAERDALRTIAEHMGYTIKHGPMAGQGSINQLVQAIANGTLWIHDPGRDNEESLFIAKDDPFTVAQAYSRSTSLDKAMSLMDGEPLIVPTAYGPAAVRVTELTSGDRAHTITIDPLHVGQDTLYVVGCQAARYTGQFRTHAAALDTAQALHERHGYPIQDGTEE